MNTPSDKLRLPLERIEIGGKTLRVGILSLDDFRNAMPYFRCLAKFRRTPESLQRGALLQEWYRAKICLAYMMLVEHWPNVAPPWLERHMTEAHWRAISFEIDRQHKVIVMTNGYAGKA